MSLSCALAAMNRLRSGSKWKRSARVISSAFKMDRRSSRFCSGGFNLSRHRSTWLLDKSKTCEEELLPDSKSLKVYSTNLLCRTDVLSTIVLLLSKYVRGRDRRRMPFPSHPP